MNIKEIYELFEQIGSLTFATVENGEPRTRIAHLFAHDREGLYFRTMTIKPFYAQLIESGKVAICGIYPTSSYSHDDDGMPYFEPGFTISVSGSVREISLEQLKAKVAVNSMFELGVKDIDKYPAMTAFCLYQAAGEIFDFDFAMEKRDHKLKRTRFTFGNMAYPFRGVRISNDCISCGQCFEGCSFKAISESEGQYVIDPTRCDVCGDCYTLCPANAIEVINKS